MTQLPRRLDNDKCFNGNMLTPIKFKFLNLQSSYFPFTHLPLLSSKTPNLFLSLSLAKQIYNFGIRKQYTWLCFSSTGNAFHITCTLIHPLHVPPPYIHKKKMLEIIYSSSKFQVLTLLSFLHFLKEYLWGLLEGLSNWVSDNIQELWHQAPLSALSVLGILSALKIIIMFIYLLMFIYKSTWFLRKYASKKLKLSL